MGVGVVRGVEMMVRAVEVMLAGAVGLGGVEMLVAVVQCTVEVWRRMRVRAIKERVVDARHVPVGWWDAGVSVCRTAWLGLLYGGGCGLGRLGLRGGEGGGDEEGEEEGKEGVEVVHSELGVRSAYGREGVRWMDVCICLVEYMCEWNLSNAELAECVLIR